MARGRHSKTRPDMVGSSNPRWARDGRVVVGQRFGHWVVLSSDLSVKCGALYVLARCRCGVVRDVSLRMAEVGRTTQCKACACRMRHSREGHLITQSAVDKRLQKRVNAMQQRCTNPKDGSYHNYGGRGIEFRFASVRSGVAYIKRYLPHKTYLKLDIDRRNNHGHYEVGNLRLVTRQQNLMNTRRNVKRSRSTT